MTSARCPDIEETSNCMSCGACANRCPANAITLVSDVDGYYIPKLDTSLCSGCGACVACCPARNPKRETNAVSPTCYAIWAQDNIRFKSSSGGVFTLLAEQTFARGGVVCGAAWNAELGVEHVIIERVEDLDRLRRSKYVQSFIGDAYRQIKSMLENETPVLFSGCPCQVAALYSYLQKDYNNLYTIDLLCTQAPSQAFFKKYLSETFGEGNVIKYDFRVKEHGWGVSAHKVILKDGTELLRDEQGDAFQMAYHSRLMMRPICEDCQFAEYPRQGDVTIGDFHWIGERDLSLDDKKGTSCLLVNNEKGQLLLDGIREHLALCRETPLEWLSGNRVAQHKDAHPARDRFYELSCYKRFAEAVDYAMNYRYDVGVIGIWSIINYGSNLTYYALYQVLRDIGLEPLMIERPRTSSWSPPDMSVLKPKLFKNNPYRPFDLAHIHTDDFELWKLGNQCEQFLVGSDQLFHPSCYNSFARYNSLDWTNDSKKRTLYAGSFGRDSFEGDEQTRAHMTYALSRFDNVSFREESALDVAKNSLGINAQQVLDPVFLCDRRHFDTLAASGSVPEEAYIGAYILDPEKRKSDILEKTAAALSLPVNMFEDITQVGTDYDGNPTIKEDRYVEDWLRNIKDAHFVVTDSFHGMCFAIIYRKPFIAVTNNGRGATRFSSLAKLFGLESRLLSTPEQWTESLLLTPNYQQVEVMLNNERERSFNWLKKALEYAKPVAVSANDVLTNKLSIIGNRLYDDEQIISENRNWLRALDDRVVENEHWLRALDDRVAENERWLRALDERVAEINKAIRLLYLIQSSYIYRFTAKIFRRIRRVFRKQR